MTAPPVMNFVFLIVVAGARPVGGRPQARSALARGGPGAASNPRGRSRRARRRRARSPSCPPSGAGLRLEPEQADPLGDEVEIQERERREVDEEGPDDDR